MAIAPPLCYNSTALCLETFDKQYTNLMPQIQIQKNSLPKRDGKLTLLFTCDTLDCRR